MSVSDIKLLGSDRSVLIKLLFDWQLVSETSCVPQTRSELVVQAATLQSEVRECRSKGWRSFLGRSRISDLVVHDSANLSVCTILQCSVIFSEWWEENESWE